jgi:hypothetical protein
MINNTQKISIPVSGLYKQQKYNFKFRGLGGNWPVTLYPMSGSFETTNNKTVNLTTVASFCQSTGLCPQSDGNVLPYSTNYQGFNTIDAVTSFVVDVTDPSDNSVKSSEPQFLQCLSCLSSPKIIMPEQVSISGGSSVITFVNNGITQTDNVRTNNYYFFNPHITGLIPGEEYKYSINSLGGNWPVLANPVSGIIKSSSDTANIELVVSFCPTTGYCPPGTNGLLNNYVLGADADTSKFYEHNYFTVLNLSLQQLNYPYSSTIGDQMVIRCKDCLPEVSTDNTTYDRTLIMTTDPYVSSYGISFVGSAADKFEFTFVDGADLPATMVLYIGAVQVGNVTYSNALYANKSFRYTRASTGVSYVGKFSNGNVALT